MEKKKKNDALKVKTNVFLVVMAKSVFKKNYCKKGPC